MALKNREKIILIAIPFLLIGMIVVWRPQVAPPERIVPTTAFEEEKWEPFRRLMATKGSSVALETEDDAWGRNPFYQSHVPAAVNELDMYPLKGISYSKENPSALIGDEVVTVGDKVGSFTITNILSDTVVISDGHKVIKLQLEKPPQ